MPETVSIIHSDGEPISVAAEKKRHSDWVKQEAQLLMDELFVNLPDDYDLEGEVLSSSFESEENWDHDFLPPPRSNALVEKTEWTSLNIQDEEEAKEPWVPEVKAPPFYHRMLLVLGGLAIVTPLSLWGTAALQEASHQKSVIAATPIGNTAGGPSASDQEFAKYAEKALQNISSEPKADTQPTVGITSLPTMPIGNIPSALPPVPAAAPAAPNLGNIAAAPSAPAPTAQAQAAPKTQATPEELNRLALSVVKPKPIQAPAIPTPSLPAPPVSAGSAITSAPNTADIPDLSNLSSITAAPTSDLPDLSASMPEPIGTIAAATPMTSPSDASHKVIGIIELGLQSTLMVTNNGSHLNFKVGDTVNDNGWKLVQIADGKAILQKGTEYKTLSEGQYF